MDIFEVISVINFRSLHIECELLYSVRETCIYFYNKWQKMLTLHASQSCFCFLIHCTTVIMMFKM